MDGLFWRFLVMACALLASFFFSASEFAVIRLDRLKVRQAAEEGSRSDRILARFLSDTGRFLSSISIGNTLANLLLSSFAAITFAPPLARRLVAADAGPGAEATAAALVTFALSYAVLVFGEIAPKQAAIAAGERFAHRVAPVLRAWAWCVHPAVWLVNAGSRLVLRPFGVKTAQAFVPAVTEDRLKLCKEKMGVQQSRLNNLPLSKPVIEASGIELINVPPIGLRNTIHSIFTGQYFNPIQHFLRKIGTPIGKNSKRHSQAPLLKV